MCLIAIFSLCENSTKPALLFLYKWRSFLSLPPEPLLWWWGLRPALGYRNVNKMMQNTTSWLDLTFGSFFLPFLWISLTEGMNISLHSSWHSLLLQVTAKTWRKERRWMQSLAGASYWSHNFQTTQQYRKQVYFPQSCVMREPELVKESESG